ncbi:MAG: restriction endonuclease subunit S [Deltaproteobacteria bacterium]|nr:restriction endonuclease subunit S [Deltaproteobacteria bacterium]
MLTNLHPELKTIPAEWPLFYVDELFLIQQEKQVSKKTRIGENQRPFLRTKNVFWGTLDLFELDRMHFSEKEEIRLSLKPGDLLVCEGGDIGRTSIWLGEIERCYYQNHLHRLRSMNGDDVHPMFELYWFWYAFAIGRLYFGRGNVTTIPNLSRSRLAELPFPKPPLPEQKKIAYVLSTVQKAIEQQEGIIQLTTELKKALMHKLFTEGTRGEPQKQTEIGPVPENWDILRLEQTGDIIYGIQASVANNFEPIGTKILTNKNITLEGGFNLEKVNYFELTTKRHKATVLKKGDLLFNWRSGSKQHVGKTAYFDLEGEYTHSSFILRIRPKREVNGRYLYHYLNWLHESGYFVRLQTYAVNAKFNKSAVNNMPTAFPSRKEQDTIADTLDFTISKIENHKRTKQALKDLFRTLLHQLMTAKICVNDIDFKELKNVPKTMAKNSSTSLGNRE